MPPDVQTHANLLDRIAEAEREGYPDNVMTERGRGVIKTWSCWAARADEVNFPHISQAACICREVRSITGEVTG
jgi:hypothetical protein